MREPLNCRELLGHEDFPELGLAVQEQQFLNLAAPVHCYFVRLVGKHLESQKTSGHRDGIGLRPGLDDLGQPPGPAQQYHSPPGGRVRPEESPELYAKVIRLLEEPDQGYILHFTSVSPAMQKHLDRLLGKLAEQRLPGWHRLPSLCSEGLHSLHRLLKLGH